MQKTESWICPGDQYDLPSSGFIFLALTEMDLWGEIRRNVILIISEYHGVFCIRWGSAHGRDCFLPQSVIMTLLYLTLSGEIPLENPNSLLSTLKDMTKFLELRQICPGCFTAAKHKVIPRW